MLASILAHRPAPGRSRCPGDNKDNRNGGSGGVPVLGRALFKPVCQILQVSGQWHRDDTCFIGKDWRPRTLPEVTRLTAHSGTGIQFQGAHSAHTLNGGCDLGRGHPPFSPGCRGGWTWNLCWTEAASAAQSRSSQGGPGLGEVVERALACQARGLPTRADPRLTSPDTHPSHVHKDRVS